MTPLKKMKIIYVAQTVVFLIVAATSMDILIIAAHGAFATYLAYRYGEMKGNRESDLHYQKELSKANQTLTNVQRRYSSLENELAILRDKVAKLD